MFFGIAVGSNFFKRKRTICVDLTDLNQSPYKPPYPDVFTAFLKNDVGVDLSKVEAVSVHPLAPYCMVKLKTEDYHDQIYEKVKDGVRWTGKGRVDAFKCNDVFTEVKVLGVSSETPLEEVGVFLQTFGEIIGDVKKGRVKNSNILDGTYYVKMILAESIPAFIPHPEDGEMWVVRHEGQDQTCFKCLGTGHMSRVCQDEPNQFGKECRLAAKAYRAQLLNDAEQARLAGEIDEERAEQERAALLREEEEQVRLENERTEDERIAQANAAEASLALERAEEARLAQERENEARLAQERVAQQNADEERLAQDIEKIAEAEDVILVKENEDQIEFEKARVAKEKEALAAAKEKTGEVSKINEEEKAKAKQEKKDRQKNRKDEEKNRKDEEKKRKASSDSDLSENENLKKDRNLSPSEQRRFTLPGGLVSIDDEAENQTQSISCPPAVQFVHTEHDFPQVTYSSLVAKPSSSNEDVPRNKLSKENRTGV